MLPECLYDDDDIYQRTPQNCENNVSPTFDVLNEEDRLELSGSYWHGKTRMAGLQYGVGRMMIISVVRAEYINVTDSYIAIATTAKMYCVRAAKTVNAIFSVSNKNQLMHKQLLQNSTVYSKWTVT